MYQGVGRANIGFINLHRAYQQTPTRTNHSNSQSVQQSPCCFITTQSKNLLKSFGINTLLLANYMPYRFKPQLQGNPTILKNSTRDNRNLKIALATAELSPLSPPGLPAVTTRTNKSIWPSYLTKICSTCFFVQELLLKFKNGFGVILHNS